MKRPVQGGLVFFPVQTALSTHPLPEPPARCDRRSWICSSKVAAHQAGPQLPQAFGHLPGQHKYTREAQPAHEHSQTTKPTGQSKLRRVFLPSPCHLTPLRFVHMRVQTHNRSRVELGDASTTISAAYSDGKE